MEKQALLAVLETEEKLDPLGQLDPLVHLGQEVQVVNVDQLEKLVQLDPVGKEVLMEQMVSRYNIQASH